MLVGVSQMWGQAGVESPHRDTCQRSMGKREHTDLCLKTEAGSQTCWKQKTGWLSGWRKAVMVHRVDEEFGVSHDLHDELYLEEISYKLLCQSVIYIDKKQFADYFSVKVKTLLYLYAKLVATMF